jgi:hypothetical protein
MKPLSRLSVVLIALLLVGGCIVGDQITTLTIHPDGSADLVVLRSNLRSTETGDKGAKELAEYKANFDARSNDELVRIRELGATGLEASWVKQDVPYSNFVRAHFPNASVLEKYGTHTDEDGTSPIKTQFKSEGTRRSLTVYITVPGDKTNAAQTSPVDAEQFRHANANAISETRIAVTRGTITTARGFTVAEDKQSALLNASVIDQVLKTGGQAELVLEWEVTP